MLRSRKMIALVLVFLVLLATGGCGGKGGEKGGQSEKPKEASNEVIKLKLGHDQAETHGYHKGAKFFADKIKEKTNGKVQVTVFPNAQLGNELTMLDTLRVGDLDMSISAGPNASTHVPALGFFSVSYLFDSKEHFLRVTTDPEFMSIIQGQVAARNLGFRPLGFLTAGLRSTYNNKKPINTVDDLKGLKMRVMASPVESRVWKTLGTLPTSIPFGEIYTAMQTGLVDAAEGSPSSYASSKHNEVAKYLSLTEHQWLVSVLWISDKTWNKLPDDVKKAMQEVAREMTTYEINLNADADKKVVEEVQSKGVKVNQVQNDGFKEKLRDLQEQVAKELEMEKALQRIRDLAK